MALRPLPEPKRGEVWLVEFEPARGAEIRKTRPAVMMNLDSVGKLPLRLVVPFTSWQEAFASVPWMVKVEADTDNGLSNDSAADAFQTRSFSVERFVKRLGELTPEKVLKIADAIAATVGATAAKT